MKPEHCLKFFSFLSVGIVSFALGSILWELGSSGVGSISLEFLTNHPESSGRSGGIAPILVSTFWIVGLALFLSIPMGLATSVFLAEFIPKNHPFSTLVRKCLDILAGVPSIVFGLFGNAFFCIYLGLGFSILSGALTLACMILPIFIRISEEGLRALPIEYRTGSTALGFSKTASIFHLLLPAALPTLVVGMLLSLGRATAETAALIFTSGYVDRMPSSVLDSGRALSIHIYDLAMNIPGGDQNAAKSALTLMFFLLLTHMITHRIAQSWSSQAVQQ